MSNLVCCIICQKEFSIKGLPGHWSHKHDPNLIEKMKEIRLKGTLNSFKKPEFQEKYKKPVSEKPKFKCHSSKCMNLTTTKFCSKSCATSTNNKGISRNPLGENGSKNNIKPRTPFLVRYRICNLCSSIDMTFKKIGRYQSENCSLCQKDKSMVYRMECSFSFDVRKYPEQFNLELLKNHNMFNPKTNPNGVVKDHLISIDFGKKNNIDPFYLSHPANCELILQKDNMKKLTKCNITLEELLTRIEVWELKYGLGPY